MIAVALLAVGVLSLARLFTVSASVLERANRASTSAILASQKIEQLRTTAARAAVPSEGFDIVDDRGAALAVPNPASAAGYTRRWSIRALPADADLLRVVHVRVTPGSPRQEDGVSSRTARAAGDVSLMTIYARRWTH